MLDRCQLLASLRVLDLGGAESDGVTRLLADLGADVLKIEPPGGGQARSAHPTVAGLSVPFALNNANKRCAILDSAEASDRDRFVELVGGADILVDGGSPGGADAFGTTCRALADQFPHLIAMSVTDFGANGPHVGWRATDAVLYAMSTALSRSGPTIGRPVLPPSGIASGTAVAQAAWAVLAAYYNRLRCGRGEYVDFSRFEAVVQSLDPPFGSEGQAAVGQRKSKELWRGRPRNQQIYPTFSCRDGYVRMCLLSARQWRGMRAWLGEPERFSDPKFETIAARYSASRELNAVIAGFLAPQTMEDIVAEGQRRGVPIAAVLTPAEALASEHLRAVGALTETELTRGARVIAPNGAFVIDGRRAGLKRPAPAPGVDEPVWQSGGSQNARSGVGSPSERPCRPFDGLRILDLGVIVAGGELGRLFADLGAEVVKVESASYPDGLRQTAPGTAMSRSWALTHRNETSLGLDLRHPDGAALFRRLVAGADAVFANFKPGTLASLGFSYDELIALNPRIVLAESSAFGASGPWSGRMGYGPLVRATTGVSRLWTDEAAEGFYDATTIFPDHVAARTTALAALAALISRESTGVGSHVHVSQAEAAVNQLAATYVAEAAREAGLHVEDGDAIDRVLPCLGDDEWCVVSIGSEADRNAVSGLTGSESLSDWAKSREKMDVARLLQEAGVPAAPMYRALDVPADPQIQARGLYTEMSHPLFEAPMLAETHSAPYQRIPDAALRPAPMAGEHTREICHKLLAMDADETELLIAKGILFSWPEPNSRRGAS